LLCMGGGSGGQACGEDQVEAAEDQLAETMSMELLQRDLNLRNTKVSQELQPEELQQQQQHQQVASQGPVATEIQETGEVVSQGSLDVAGQAEQAEWDGEDEEVQEPAVNCTEHPVFCDPKMNCAGNPITAAERKAWGKKLATKDGHANFRSWCMVYPMYSSSLGKCIVDNDKTEYARIMYEDQEKANLNAADAVYCFVAGHCNSTDVSLSTTEQEAEKICDANYGHRWKNVGWNDFMGVVARAQKTLREGQEALRDGNKTWSELLTVARKEAEISAMTSCAMGIYQCDVFYCKNNYCNNDLYRNQFGNMSWS